MKISADLHSFAENHGCQDTDMDASNFKKEIIKIETKQPCHLISVILPSNSCRIGEGRVSCATGLVVPPLVKSFW